MNILKMILTKKRTATTITIKTTTTKTTTTKTTTTVCVLYKN